jgi:alpha-tubulin suppressor-like RCC1 family protein
MNSRLRGLLPLLLLLPACKDSLAPQVPGSLQALSAPASAGIAGELLPDSVAVRVLDLGGRPMAGVSVQFSITDGGGIVSPASVRTNGDGTARAAWTLGTRVGANLLVARVSGGAVDALVFSVDSAPGSPNRLGLQPDHPRINAIGFAVELSVSPTDRHGNARSDVSVEWSSLDPAIAGVDESGRVIAVGNGTARIVATAGSLSDTAQVVVQQVAAMVSLSAERDRALVGETIQLTVVAADSNGVAMDASQFTWSTGEPDAAAVEPDGRVRVVGVGSVAISAVNGAAATVELEGRIRPVLFAGIAHSCALNATGEAYCWGQNDVGQLGDGTTGDRDVPTRVAGSLRFKALTVGNHFACGLTNSGALFCWGQNLGQFGDGTTDIFSATPVPGAVGLRLAVVTAGGMHACGLTPDGVAYCWGSGRYGQLGNGSVASLTTPAAVASGEAFRAIEAGAEHTCGITVAGQTRCWGYNHAGSVGDGSFVDRPLPVPVLDQRAFVTVRARGHHSCGVTDSGETYCWGYNRQDLRQLGVGSDTSTPVPLPILVRAPVADISPAMDFHGCAVVRSGGAFCWGSNVHGALGNGSTANALEPVAVAGGLDFRSISTGQFHTCGLTATDDAHCWGANARGQVGDGTGVRRLLPVPVAGWAALRGGG